jgi:hypothetical protein
MSEDAFIDHILSLKRQVSAYGQEVDRLCGEIAKRDAEIERLRADRRERIATAALQGLLSDPNRQGTFSDAVRISVEYADALIAELDKEEGKP